MFMMLGVMSIFSLMKAIIPISFHVLLGTCNALSMLKLESII